MIPNHLVNQRSMSGLMEYLLRELHQAKSSRKELENIWQKYHTAYRARPHEEENNFPFARSSNLIIPVIATDVDTIYARLMSMYFGGHSLWVCRALNDQMVEFAPRLEEFLDWAQNNELNIYEPVADWLLETVKLGTGVLKTRYTREQRKVYEFREVGNPDGSISTLERQARVLIKDHPQVDHVPLWNFYVPPGYYDIQPAPWVAERIDLNWNQLMQRWRQGIYTNVEHLGRYWADNRIGIVERNLDQIDRYVPSQSDKFELYEFWLDWDIDADGEPEALVCTIHPDTKTYVRLDFNPFFNQEKPYDFSRYMRAEKRFYGIGIAEMLYQFQLEISAMHNQRRDNHSVANALMFKALKNGNIKQDEPLFPGRILLVDSMDEVQPLMLGVPYTADIQQENLSLQYASRRTGVNDFVEGFTGGSTNYATATTAVQQLREGAKRIDQTMRENRRCLSAVGVRVTELYQQFNQGGKPFLAMGEKDGQYVEQILQFPMEIIRAGVQIDVRATSASQNKEVEMRTNMLLMEMTTQYYMQILQALQIALNPQLPEPIRNAAMDSVVAGNVLMRRIMDIQGVQDIDTIVPRAMELFNAGQQAFNPLAAALGGGPAMGAGPAGPPGIQSMGGGAGGVAGLLGAGTPAGNGNGQYV